MRGSKAQRLKVRVGNFWESPILHILLTKEDDVIVARCLEFTVSSHGSDEEDALKALADSIKEYILTALENNAIDHIFDPAHSKYWRMFNELEAKQSSIMLRNSLKKALKSISNENIRTSTAEISYA